MDKPLAPGAYTVQLVRSRKVRNKPYIRMHFVIPETGQTFVDTIKQLNVVSTKDH